ncbi:DNA glycosylase [Guyanagaster necrorhizus]|uniref:Adenine DNA glycosylase n=1 Tax=Guyanagaster necrorhizus TaxID=856835 RepID=A0A9P7W6E3_9AGAR|nr:DNA glycosylase [Guyanagaster necrorhizus MCA 3950]KAG7452096.1 DNA glycosylase [Guyanagaster necrorhizus MCA 3950]
MGKRRRVESDDDYTEFSQDEIDGNYGSRVKNRKATVSKKMQPVAVSPSIADYSDEHSRSQHVISNADEVCDALLRWYSGVHMTRGMPWRKEYNPNLGREERAQRAYEVLVSEFMLQQTQVVTVIPYYEAWVSRFPTIHVLAAATVDEVNAVWKGLGYYRRASRLLAGSQKTVAKFSGLLPDNARDLEANIPGVGRYTAGAVCSIAYGERVPVLDGNVHRLLCRLLALHAPHKAVTTLNILWAAATTLVQCENHGNGQESDDSMVRNRYPGDINQALIELGSTVCKVNAPSCGQCPLKSHCTAYQSELVPLQQDMEDICTLCEPRSKRGVTAYPMKAERKKPRVELDLVNVIEWRSKSDPENRQFLLVRRPNEGLLAGLYEFPTEANISRTLSDTHLAEIPRTQLSALLQSPIRVPESPDEGQSDGSCSIVKTQPAGDVFHVFSHIRKTYRVQWVIIEGGNEPPETAVPQKPCHGRLKATMWKSLKEISTSNIGKCSSKIWDQVQTLWETAS